MDTRILTESFRLRAHPEEVELWKAASEEEGLSVAEWLRERAAESPTAQDAHRAHRAVAEAISGGNLLRQPCETCGAAALAHHDDYLQPLDVRWLCRKHHRAWHKEHPMGIAWPQLSFRLTTEELELLKAASSFRGISLVEWSRVILVTLAKQTLKEEQNE